MQFYRKTHSDSLPVSIRIAAVVPLLDESGRHSSELIHVQSEFGVMDPFGDSAVVLDEKLARPVESRGQEMPGEGGVVPAARDDVQMKIDFALKRRDIARKVRDFHLLIELLVDIFLCRRVKEPQCHSVERPDARDAPGFDAHVPTESRESTENLDMIVKAHDEPVS